MSLRAAATDAARRLTEARVPDPAFEGEYLARHAAGVSRAAFYAGAEVSQEHLEELASLVERRARREPAAYITGEREFFGLPFAVGPGVLVPRPETEMLVELAIEELSCRPDAVAVDVGTGSGCIAVALAAALPTARVFATDISIVALEIARENAVRNGATVSFVCGDLASGLSRADVVLANLPYIPTGEIDALEPEVSRWEPRVALDGGSDGFSLIRRLVDDCASRLRPRLLAFEVGFGQAESVAEHCRSRGASVSTRRDLAGIERVVCARWE